MKAKAEAAPERLQPVPEPMSGDTPDESRIPRGRRRGLREVELWCDVVELRLRAFVLVEQLDANPAARRRMLQLIDAALHLPSGPSGLLEELAAWRLGGQS